MKHSHEPEHPNDESLAAEDDAVVAAIQAAVDDAIEAHRRDGDPIQRLR